MKAASRPQARITAAALLMAFVTAAIDARGQSGGQFEILTWTADSGGRTSSGGTFSVTGTIAQPDTGQSDQGRFVVDGGFWSLPPGFAENLFIDQFEQPQGS